MADTGTPQAHLNMLDHLSKAVFNNSHFVQILGSSAGSSTPSDTSFMKIADAVKKDSDLNGYQPGATTINVPHFTYDIISLLPPGEAGAARSSPTSHGSSAFDLAQRLSLLPDQEYGVLLAMIPVDVEKVPRYHSRYGGYLSRHALLYLASQYGGRVSTVGEFTVVDTTIGRFKVFEYEHRTHVYFDPGTRAAQLPKQLPGVPDLDTLKKYAGGEYLVKDLVIDIETIASAAMTWTRANMAKFSTTKIIQPPEHRVFISKDAMAQWDELERYTTDLRQASANIFGSMSEPHRVARFRDNLIENKRRNDNSLKTDARLPEEMIENKVAISAYVSFMTVGSSERMAIISNMDTRSIHDLCLKELAAYSIGHPKFRGVKDINQITLAETTEKRFSSLYELWKEHPNPDILEVELRKLLRMPSNICLVLLQGNLATVAYWNACKVREFAIGAPEEWIQFVLAQDSDVTIG